MSSQCFDQERLEHPVTVSQAYSDIAPPSSASRLTIDMLPDLALLKIFDFYLNNARIDEWHGLVHVCRKWRNVVFGSPCHLDLRIQCNYNTPAREMLAIWPLLPIVIWDDNYQTKGVENVTAALEHSDRIREVTLWNIPNSNLDNVLTVMTQPFPALTVLRLQPKYETALVDPASFLGGSLPPRLELLHLDCISFPGLPKLLLSATHLVNLRLWRIPRSGYISPEAIVTCLSALTRLEYLSVGFDSPQYRPDRNTRRLPPPQTRTLLPVLTGLWFQGVSEYLEDLVAWIDVPLLNKLIITFFHQLIFNTPQLNQFITRIPTFKAHDEARVVFLDSSVWVTLSQTFDGPLTGKLWSVRISCRKSDWQLSSLAQVFSSSLPRALIPAVERLYITHDIIYPPLWQHDIESSQWFELLRPFTAVKGLYLSWAFAPRIAPVLQELVGERVIEVLPALETLFLEEALPSGPIQEAIEQFVAARQLAGHPIALSHNFYSND